MDSAVHAVFADYSNLKSVLRQYDVWLSKYPDDLRIDGKSYTKANSEQAGLLAYYSELADELSIITEDFEFRLSQKKSAAMRVLQKEPKLYPASLLNQFANEDQNVHIAWKALAEVKERHEKAKTIVNAFIRRGFDLNNMTKTRSAGFHDEIIRVDE